jgi:hypothetical protein
LRVIVRYTDGFGKQEVVTSAATAAVAVIPGIVLQGTNAANTLNGTVGNDVLLGLQAVTTRSMAWPGSTSCSAVSATTPQRRRR